jgi:Protein of unknown function (DUF3891)
MVVREDAGGIVGIGQPSHAWLSGQLGRAWGNERFGAVWPWEEVCLAAEQHDVGMAGWDLEPELDPDTGRPRSFMEMTLETHLELWSAAPHRLRAQSRYAALLVSLHGTSLYARRDLEAMDPARASAVRRYLADQRALQEGWLAELRADPATARAAEPASVERNRALVWAWDTLSLALLLDWAPHDTDPVPAVGESMVVRLAPLAPEHGRFTLDPWPFARERVVLHCEGRRLADRFDDEAAMHAALARADWITLTFELVPEGRA